MEEYKIDTDLRKSDWQQSLVENTKLIVQNKIQIEMAANVIELCKVKIAEFPEDIVKPIAKSK